LFVFAMQLTVYCWWISSLQLVQNADPSS